MLSRRPHLAEAALFLVATVSWLHAETRVINVDIGKGRSPVYVGQGAAGTGGTHWNAVGPKMPAALLDSQGKATPVSVLSMGPGFLFWQEDPDWTMTVKGAEDLMRDYHAIGRTQPITIELGGIPIDWNFDLFVYAAGDTNDQGVLVTVQDQEQRTTGIESPGKSLTKGLHYVVFTGLKARAGTLLIQAVHNPDQPGKFGMVNGFQLIARDEPQVAAVPPPSGDGGETGSGLSSGLWVIIGFGLAVVFVVVLRLVLRPGSVTAVGATPVRELPSSSGHSPEVVTTDSHQALSEQERTLQERAEAAERRANAAETVVRDGLMPEMKKILKQ